MTEIVLSATAGDLAVVDGVDRTMMIAAETTGTAAIIFPCGQSLLQNDVADGTCFLATPAVGADIGIEHEFPVGNHEAVEVGTDDVTEGPRGESELQLTIARLPLFNDCQKEV